MQNDDDECKIMMMNAKYDNDRGEMMMRNDDDAGKMTNNNTKL